MKNNDGPKVIVIHVSNNIVSGIFGIGEFSGMGELIPHATKFASFNLVPRILLSFMKQTQPKSSTVLSAPLRASVCNSHRSYAVPRDRYYSSIIAFIKTVA